MIVEGDDAGGAGPHHLNRSPTAEPHFLQPRSETLVAVDLVDSTLLARSEEFKGNKPLQLQGSCRVTMRLRIDIILRLNLNYS